MMIYAVCALCSTVALMQEKIVGKSAFLSRNGDTGGDAECYTSVLRRTVRGK